MGYKLCIAEKPSVASDIARVIGATKRCNGYFEGNGYRVTWAVGHLVGLAEPEEYGFLSQKEMYNGHEQEAMNELPLIPKEFKLIVLEPTKDQFEIVKSLMLSNECSELINCGDMGAEGHILQAFIQWKAGYTKPAKRFCATSMTDEAIREAMTHLRNQSEFDNAVIGEFCKKKADWIMGMSLSRAESLKYHANISVGRVQTPTLFFIVSRFMAVTNFKVTNYYGLELKLKEGFSVFWNDDKDGIFPNNVKDESNRVLNENVVKEKARQIIQNGTAKVTEFEQKKCGNDRPQLYDITELQRDANRKYGYSPALTLACAQCLYESHKVTSYPRTDSRYITSDLKPYMAERVRMVSTVQNAGEAYKKCANELLGSGLRIDGKIVDDSKVTDHHAIIPTEKIENFDMDSLCPVTQKDKKDGVTKENLKNVLGLILTRLIVSFSSPCVYNQTKVTIETPNGFRFRASGKIVLDNGWKSVQDKLAGKEEEEKDDEADDEQSFPNIRLGQQVFVSDCLVKAKKTTPPKLHTEATLLTAMETAGRGEKGAEILKGKGIGTQATRAEIIKSLFDKGYCAFKKQGKTNYIVPTANGIKVIQVIPKELYSPMITANWENKIAMIADGKMDAESFMRDFENFIIQKVSEVKNSTLQIEFQQGREIVASCPWCDSPMYKFDTKDKNGKAFFKVYCSNKECNCSISSNNALVNACTGKNLTLSQMKDLLIDGRTVLKCKSTYDENKTYSREFFLGKREYEGKTYTDIKSGETVKSSKGSKGKATKKKKGGSGLFD